MKFLPFVSRFFIMLFVVSSLVLTGCASRGGKTYNDREVRQAQKVTYGVVAEVSEVTVEDDPSGGGTVLGGVAGGVLGSLLGGGKGRVLTALGGAAVGALAGTAAESSIRGYKAYDITVDLDNNGGTIVIVQAKDDVFVKGDRVRIVTTNMGISRVQHSNR